MVKTFRQFNEGKMKELLATIQDHVDSHIKDYNSGKLGHDQFGERLEKAKARIAKLHNLSMDTTSKHVNSYVDSRMKEDWLKKQPRSSLDKLM